MVLHAFDVWCQRTFDFPNTERLMEQYWSVPITVTILYLIMVLVIPGTFMKHREPFNLRYFNIVWNLFLSSFSFVGLIIVAPRWFELVFASRVSVVNSNAPGGEVGLYDRNAMLSLSPACQRNMVRYHDGGNSAAPAKELYHFKGSLDLSMCAYVPEFYKKGSVGLFCFFFAISKIPEMIDTFFLVFQKKKIVFLHWYHHITVMLFCWHAWITCNSAGMWFVTMNYFVHSIMYLYYFMCSIGLRKKVRPVAPFITMLQILQMVVGAAVSFYAFYQKFVPALFFSEKASAGGKRLGCDVEESNAILAIIMYVSYFYLFAKLYVDNYIRRDKNGGGGRKEAPTVSK